jgi:hypothetical protein
MNKKKKKNPKKLVKRDNSHNTEGAFEIAIL